jgi:hypothetical protein
MHLAFADVCPCRLIELCEARLMSELRQMPPAAAAAEAPHLVCLADELGLVQLRRGAVAFISQHYDQVQVSMTAGGDVLERWS